MLALYSGPNLWDRNLGKHHSFIFIFSKWLKQNLFFKFQFSELLAKQIQRTTPELENLKCIQPKLNIFGDYILIT